MANENVLTVSALSQYINQKFERDPHLQKIRVVGEVSNYRYRANSHQYFALKEDKYVINAIVFKQKFAQIKFQLEEGMRVIVSARVGVYPGAGRYQLYVDAIEPDGIGSLYLALEQLKEKMRKAGYFDRPKKAIPAFPKKIAVITSPSGAVIRDIMTTVKRRFPLAQIIVFPARVQGQEAIKDLMEAFDQVKAHQNEIDVVILARGGGSIEDLWCFNDEELAHRILDCSLPVISSIGHETDTTIADLVADLRAATPTAAAELAVPVLTDLYTKVDQARQRLLYAFSQTLKAKRDYLQRLSSSYTLSQPQRIYQAYDQTLDYLKAKLASQANAYFKEKHYLQSGMTARLIQMQPSHRIELAKEQLSSYKWQLNKAINSVQGDKEKLLQNLMGLLDAYSPLKIMDRGYAIVSRDDQIINDARLLKMEDPLKIRMRHGVVYSRVESVDSKIEEE